MPRNVSLTPDAERDLEDIYWYIAEHDSRPRAEHVLDRLLEVVDKLSSQAERGSIPQELRALGMAEFRQVFFKPYRVIYRTVDNHVSIYLIVDGRRDMQTVLAQRMFAGR